MHLIAFSGGYGCGKSTAIKALEPWTDGRELVLIKFAEELYAMQEFIYGRIARVYQRPADFTKDRKLLQWLGTEWGRGVDQDLWVNIWKDKVRQALAKNPNALIVCDDCRFDNEAEVVKELGGVIIKLERSNNASHALGGTGIANHASEIGLAPQFVDYIVENNSTLQSFQDSLSYLFGELGVSGGRSESA